MEYGELSIFVTVGDSYKSEVKVGGYSVGSAFGELALVFDSPRAATIKATTDCKLWTLERLAYRGLIGQIRFRQREEKLDFLRHCKFQERSFMDVFDGSQIEDLSIAIKTDQYEQGGVILREGEMNDTLYVVRSGVVSYAKGKIEEMQAFGANALLKSSPSHHTYTAETAVVVYYLTRKDLETMVGQLQDCLDGKSVSRSMIKNSSKRTIKTSMTMDQRYNLNLEDLKFFNKLGKGAFGTVMLVQSKQNKKVFALKALSKDRIVKKGQAEHVLNEFRIMKECDHPSILGMHCAMQDKKYLYFLLDLQPGGELMSYLIKHRRFTEDVTRFYAASVILAFEQLHSIMIAYRDLKPENVVLDKNGFGILVDFGLAKEIDEGQTFTFCGTPDYLAPEIIRGTGHDWAVDVSVCA